MAFGIEHKNNLSDEDLVYYLRNIVGVTAIQFCNSIGHHFPHMSGKIKGICTDLNTDIPLEREHHDRFENLGQWGRLWIGYVWREVNKLGTPGAKTRKQLDDLTDVYMEEVVNPIGNKYYDGGWFGVDDATPMGKWYSGHDLEHWRTCLADNDSAGSRQIRRMGTLGRCGDLVYDINVANVKDGVMDGAAAKKEFEDLVKLYDVALSFHRSYIEPPVFYEQSNANVLNPRIGNPGTYQVPLGILINDHDHDSLTLEAESNDTNVVTVVLDDTNITMTCVDGGTTTVDLRAENIKGRATLTFNITCVTLPGS